MIGETILYFRNKVCTTKFSYRRLSIIPHRRKKIVQLKTHVVNRNMVDNVTRTVSLQQPICGCVQLSCKRSIRETNYKAEETAPLVKYRRYYVNGFCTFQTLNHHVKKEMCFDWQWDKFRMESISSSYKLNIWPSGP